MNSFHQISRSRNMSYFVHPCRKNFSRMGVFSIIAIMLLGLLIWPMHEVQARDLDAPAQQGPPSDMMAYWPVDVDGTDPAGYCDISSGSYDSSNYILGSGSLAVSGGGMGCTGWTSLPSTISISLWAYIPSAGSNIQTIFANSSSGESTSGLRLFVNGWQTPDGSIAIETGNGSSGSSVTTEPGQFNFGAWNHIVVTLDQTTGMAQIYHDGSLITSGSVQTGYSLSSSVYFGAMQSLNAMSGNLDDIRLYSYQLSSSQVNALYGANTAQAAPLGYSYTIGTGTQGSANGQFAYPIGVAVDANGWIYITDYNNHRVQIFDASGTYTRTIGTGVAGSENDQFYNPTGVAVDSSGNVYVADSNNRRIQVFDASGTYSRTIGAGYGSGNSQFIGPYDVVVDANGTVYVADTGNSTSNNRIQVFDASGAYSRTIGTGISGNANDQLAMPRSVTVDANGTVYVADTNNHRIQIFDASGTYIRTIGTGVQGSGNDQFSSPWGVAVDASGTVYVVDRNNHRIQIFDASGTYSRTIGIGYGSGNDQFSSPIGVIFLPLEPTSDNAPEELSFWLEETEIDGTRQAYGPVSIALESARSESSIFLPFLSR